MGRRVACIPRGVTVRPGRLWRGVGRPFSAALIVRRPTADRRPGRLADPPTNTRTPHGLIAPLVAGRRCPRLNQKLFIGYSSPFYALLLSSISLRPPRLAFFFFPPPFFRLETEE